MSLPYDNITVIKRTDLVLGDATGTPLSATSGKANVPHKELQDNIKYLEEKTNSLTLDNLAAGSIVKKHLEGNGSTDTTSLAPLVTGGNANNLHRHPGILVELVDDYQITADDYNKTFTNTNTTKNITITLPSYTNVTAGFKVTILNHSYYTIEISSSDTIYSKNNDRTISKNLYMQTMGVITTLEYVTNGIWFATNNPNSVKEVTPRGNLSFVPMLSFNLGLPFYQAKGSTVTLPASGAPDEGCFDGRYLWVCNTALSAVSKVDTLTNTLVKNITVGTLPDYACFDGRYIWVTNNVDGTVSKIDPYLDTVIATVGLSGIIDGICFDGNKIWVAGYGSNNVFVVDPETNALLHTVSLYDGNPQQPTEVCFDGTHVWVTCNASASNKVKKINALTYVIDGIVGVGGNPEGVTFDGRYIWVVNNTGYSISVVDPTTNTVVNTINLKASSYPHGISFDGKYIWVACPGVTDGSGINEVAYIDANSAHISGGATPTYLNLGTYTRPMGLVFDGSYVWAVCNKSNNIVRFHPK